MSKDNPTDLLRENAIQRFLIEGEPKVGQEWLAARIAELGQYVADLCELAKDDYPEAYAWLTSLDTELWRHFEKGGLHGLLDKEQ